MLIRMLPIPKLLCLRACLPLFISVCVISPILTAEEQTPQPPPIPVQVEEIRPQSMRLWNEFSGRLQAVDSVEIKPRVGGHIVSIQFEEGAYVEQGDVLFEIDPRPYQTEIARIRGQLNSAVSQAQLAEVDLARIENLYKDKVVPKRDLDQAKNDRRVALASIDVARAELERAELNLEYATITSPITGRISRAEITEGNLIETIMGAPVLTTIVATDQLYAEFDVDEQTYLNINKQSGVATMMPVEMSLSTDNNTVFQGHIHSFDNQINTSTGTIRARALFENPERILIPGMFVNVRIGAAAESNKILLTERAVGTDQDKKYIYILTADNQVEYQQVTLGKRIEDKRIIQTDLPEGTRVVINNIHLIRPGMTVTPTLINAQ